MNKGARISDAQILEALNGSLTLVEACTRMGLTRSAARKRCVDRGHATPLARAWNECALRGQKTNNGSDEVGALRTQVKRLKARIAELEQIVESKNAT